MARVELVMPKMGESIMEATILKWLKKPGDKVEMDDPILEIATDKVDSEVPSPVTGVLQEVMFPENEVVAIGKVIAVIETEVGSEVKASPMTDSPVAAKPSVEVLNEVVVASNVTGKVETVKSNEGKFYSPLVKNIAKEEGVGQMELDSIKGSGAEGRVTKQDILNFVVARKSGSNVSQAKAPSIVSTPSPQGVYPGTYSGNHEIVEMDRMRKLIADHMILSKQTSPHVTSFIEADVTGIVLWRNKVKDSFKKQYGENITFTPVFVEAVAKALKDFPGVNASVDGTKVIIKKDINIGMAAALPSGNLIVPVIRNAETLNMIGLTKTVNDLANRARTNQLKPDDIQGGTFTLTNVGTFGNVMGTPIINQPQVAIMATGAIRKRPAVLETEHGDVIAIRHMMFLSLSYDHRVVDGMMGGSFLKRVSEYLENFDDKQTL
jgi:2-oxoglutarate dehydrogenase E2 component (dihydrolipoamide succinyltransferase)